MEYVKDTELKGIQLSYLDTSKARKDVPFVKYSYNGMEIPIAHVVTIS